MDATPMTVKNAPIVAQFPESKKYPFFTIFIRIPRLPPRLICLARRSYLICSDFVRLYLVLDFEPHRHYSLSLWREMISVARPSLGDRSFFDKARIDELLELPQHAYTHMFVCNGLTLMTQNGNQTRHPASFIRWLRKYLSLRIIRWVARDPTRAHVCFL
jgi:hypothetical protein